MKHLLLKTWLMLVCLIVGVGTSWGAAFSGTFNKITTTDALTTGKYVIVGGSTANAMGAYSTYWASVALGSTINSGKTVITNPDAAVVWDITKDGSNYIISQTSQGTTKYIGFTGTSNNNNSFGTTNTDNKTKFTASVSSGIFTLTNVNYTSRQLRYNSSSPRFSNYSGQTALTLFKLESTPTNYTITVANNIANGTVTASPTSAAAGATVTLTATPADGYEFGSWNVTDASSNAITVTDNKFTMPAADVNVSATFNAAQGGGSGNETTVTFDNLGYASWGKSASFSGSTYDELSQTKSDVVFDYTRGSGSTYANTTSIRFYKDNQLKFTAPDGYKITSIVWTGSSFKDDVTTDVETCTSTTSALSWSGNASSVTFTRPSSATSYATLSSVSVTIVAEGGNTPDPEKTLIGIEATGTPAEFWKGDAFNHNGITVTATWDDETETDVTSFCEFSGYDMSTSGQQKVTVTYQGETCQYDIEVKTIANTQATAYTVAQAKALIDAGRDLATQVYVKGTVSQIITAWSSQYNNITYAISDDGETSGTQFLLYRCTTNGAGVGDDVVAYGTLTKNNDTYVFAAGNSITKIEKLATLSIADITVVNGEDITPVITTNVTGDYAIEYTSDNEDVVLAEGYELVTMGAGNATITATLTADGYKEVQTTFNVTVTTGATVTSVTLSGELTKKTYTIGDAFDHTGLVATANYSDDTHIDVTETATWEVDPETLTTAGNITVIVSASFGGQEDIQEYEVTVNKKAASISFAPATIDVEVDKNITLAPTTSPADAVISYTITEGSEYVSLDGAVVTGVAEGTTTIRADFAGNDEYAPASTTVTINVVPADESITVTQTGFDSLGENMTDDTNGEDTNLSYIAEQGDAGTAPALNPNNSTYIRLYQNGGKITIKGVKGVRISSASLTTGSTYETTTIAHVADPDNDTDTPTTGTCVNKNTTYTASGLDCNSITFYCLGTDNKSRIDVAALSVKYTKEIIELSSIALSGIYKTEFVQNSTFSHEGVVVTATYTDDDTQIVTSNAVFSDPDMTTTGTKTVTVSYTEGDVTKTATYDITIVAEEVTAIKLSGEYQTTFRVDETFNHENLVVKADYNSGRTNIDVTSNAAVSTPDMSVAGEQTVTVTYGGQNANYTIKVLSANTIFYESFDTNNGTGGNDDKWSGSIASNTLTADNNTVGNVWTFASGNGANKCAKFGAGSAKGAATTPALGYEGAAIMTFKSAAWNGNNENTVVNLSIVGDGAISQSSVTNTKGAWNTYTVILTGLTAESKVKFEAANSSNNRFFLDEVLIVEPTNVTFSEDDEEIEEIEDKEFQEIVVNRTIKGGTEGNYGVWNTFCVPFAMTTEQIAENFGADAEVKKLDGLNVNGTNFNMHFGDSKDANEKKVIEAGVPYMVRVKNTVTSIIVRDADGVNVNTTNAPECEVKDGIYSLIFHGNYTKQSAPRNSFIISSNKFYFVDSDVNLKGFRGYITTSEGAQVQALFFSFDDGIVTGISTNIDAEQSGRIYNLQGLQQSKLQRGVNIVNGRKVIK